MAEEIEIGFDIPFADKGFKMDIPMDPTDDGSVSFTLGYGGDYQLKPEEGGKFIERGEINKLFNLTTKSIINLKDGLLTFSNGAFQKSNIVQTVGQNTTKVMSQKAVSDQLNLKVDKTTTVNGKNLSNNITITTQDTFKNTVLLRNVDLNTLSTTATLGVYFQDLDENALKSLNYPINRAGSLEVLRSSGVIQRYISWNPVAVFIRVKYSTSWTPWKKISSMEDTTSGELPAEVDQIFIFERATPPSGYIARNGQAIDQATMPKLYAKYGANLPDDRDRALRMAGELAGTAGTTQEDAMQEMSGLIRDVFTGRWFSESGVFKRVSKIETSTEFGSVYRDGSTIEFKSSYDARTSTETRVKSRIVIFCNKIQ